MRRATRGPIGALISWFACLAILIGSLAPLIAQAIQHQTADQRSDICTAHGNPLVSLDRGVAGKRPVHLPAKHLLEHCPYCSLHLDAMWVPPGLASKPALLALDFEMPTRFLTAPRTSFVWAAAQARAPPLGA